jgi:hypothetical protein
MIARSECPSLSSHCRAYDTTPASLADATPADATPATLASLADARVPVSDEPGGRRVVIRDLAPGYHRLRDRRDWVHVAHGLAAAAAGRRDRNDRCGRDGANVSLAGEDRCGGLS